MEVEPATPEHTEGNAATSVSTMREKKAAATAAAHATKVPSAVETMVMVATDSPHDPASGSTIVTDRTAAAMHTVRVPVGETARVGATVRVGATAPARVIDPSVTVGGSMSAARVGRVKATVGGSKSTARSAGVSGLATASMIVRASGTVRAVRVKATVGVGLSGRVNIGVSGVQANASTAATVSTPGGVPNVTGNGVQNPVVPGQPMPGANVTRIVGKSDPTAAVKGVRRNRVPGTGNSERASAGNTVLRVANSLKRNFAHAN